MSGKNYFPNNWQKYKDVPDDFFMPHTYDEIMHFKISAWELPSNVCCVIRESDLESKKVKEYVYQRRAAAEKKVKQLMNKDGIEFTVCTPDQIHFVSPHDIDEYEDEQEDS